MYLEREATKAKYLREQKRLDDLPGLKELNKKKIIVYFLRKFTDKTLRDTIQGQRMRAVNKIVKRLEIRRRADEKLAMLLKCLEINVKCVGLTPYGLSYTLQDCLFF